MPRRPCCEEMAALFFLDNNNSGEFVCFPPSEKLASFGDLLTRPFLLQEAVWK